MKFLVILTLIFISGCLVDAWGGLFNRFNPTLLSNYGYGGSGRSKDKFYDVVDEEYTARKPPMSKALKLEMYDRGINENNVESLEDPCNEKPCLANEQCCKGQVCVDTDQNMGKCLPIWGNKLGEACIADNDCETGFQCSKNEKGINSCQSPLPGENELGDDCRTSSDCKIRLCCKLQRRARNQPKKMCTYFTDPAMCIGSVNTRLNDLNDFEHTAGEKRLSGHPDDYLQVGK